MKLTQGEDDLRQYLDSWPPAQEDLKRALLELAQTAGGIEGSQASFLARPGISHSLRFTLSPAPAGRQRPVFFLTDVVEFDGELLLSVCFYADEISDPEELGNEIPEALFKETGYCFDVEDFDPDLLAYLKDRITEACRAASRRSRRGPSHK